MPSDSSSVRTQETLALHGGEPAGVDRPETLAHGPAEIGDEEIAAVTEVLRSRNLFRFGRPPEESPTARFEKLFGEMTEVPHVLAVNSGTSALICAMVGLGVSTGDEVIIPAYTYIATPAAVLSRGAVPVIAEIDESLTMDPADVEAKITPRTRAIVPVHMRGTPCRMQELLDVARRHNLQVLEDVAQANGGAYRGRPLGSFGDAAGFSLQQFKIITAGEGGAFVAREREVYERGACFHDSAYTFWLEHHKQLHIDAFLGENYRMSELNGALALVQLRKRDRILQRTRAAKRRIMEQVGDLENIGFQDVPDPDGDCGIGLVMLAESDDRARRISEALSAENITAGTVLSGVMPDRHIFCYWDYIIDKRTPDRTGYPWNHSDLAYDREMCPKTLDVLGRTISLPLSQTMSDAHVDSIARSIRKVLAQV